MTTSALTHATPRTAGEVLTESRELVRPAMRAAVDTLPPPVRFVAGYQFGWWDRIGRPGEAAGKALRPALALLAADAVGDVSPAVPAGGG
ncbi:MAG: polyprenyl synthetase family protein, partial [Micromonosporaceae bacterium]